MSPTEVMPQPAAVSPQKRTSYLPQLDGLRGIAILSVLVHHFEVELPPWIDWGPIGVRTFFLLSGYLITLSLWKMGDRAADGGGYWRELAAYHLRRFVRLAPVLYLMLAIGVLLGLDHFKEGLGWHLLFGSNFYTLLHNDWPGAASHLWSLSLQEQFYVVWPLVILLIPRRHLPWALLAFFLGGFAFRFGCLATGASPFYQWMMLPGVLDSFALGALIACWKSSDHRLPLASGKAGLVVAVAAISCYVMARFMRYAEFSSPFLALTETFENVFLGWVLLRTIEGWSGALGTIFENRVLVYFGKISYGLFVFHALVHVVVSPVLDRVGLILPTHAWERTAILLPISIGVASLSWKFLEQPLARRIRASVNRPEKTPTPASASA